MSLCRSQLGLLILMLTFAGISSAHAQQPRSPAAQNPSPMIEKTRSHDRIGRGKAQGRVIQLDHLFDTAPTLFVRDELADRESLDVLVHFHGAPEVPIEATEMAGAAVALIVVNLGSGSRAYEQPFAGTDAFHRLLGVAADTLGKDFGHIYLSAFSAGYGAVRALLSDNDAPQIEGVLLLDGLHTSYIPDGMPIADGGRIDTTLLAPFLEFAKQAAAGEKTFVFTHSEVFPGTFASTTESADHLIESLGLTRRAVLKWGPVGMQQLSETMLRGFVVLGFAGNSAPDHVDHLHGMGDFLSLLIRPSRLPVDRPRIEAE